MTRSLAEYGNSQTGGSRETQTIVCMSIDDLLAELKPPSVIKIDVEGAELELLSASRKLFADIRPAINCEVGSRNVVAVSEICRAANYKMFDAALPFCRQNELKDASWNTIALPAENVWKYFD